MNIDLSTIFFCFYHTEGFTIKGIMEELWELKLVKPLSRAAKVSYSSDKNSVFCIFKKSAFLYMGQTNIPNLLHNKMRQHLP